MRPRRMATRTDPAWAHRRLLLAAGDRLSRGGLTRLRHVLAVDDPTNEIGAAWGIKELLRQLLAAPTPHGPRSGRGGPAGHRRRTALRPERRASP